jgi:hypothetical protein
MLIKMETLTSAFLSGTFRRIVGSLRGLDPLSRPKVGRFTLSELLSWGVPITLITFCVAGAFTVLGTTEVGPDEFWIARGCFVAAGLLAVARIVLWGATTSRSLPIRLLVGGLIIGASAVLTIEAVRYVNRKHSRWLDAQKPLLSPAVSPLASEPSAAENQTTKLEKPNLVFKQPEYMYVHAKYGGILQEGRNEDRNNFDADIIAMTLPVENEFSDDEFKASPVSGVTAQLLYQPKDGEPFRVNRGAWVDRGNRTSFGVNDIRQLILALNIMEDGPKPVVIRREYQETFNHLVDLVSPLDQESYQVQVKLISETLGVVYAERKVELTFPQNAKTSGDENKEA